MTAQILAFPTQPRMERDRSSIPFFFGMYPKKQPGLVPRDLLGDPILGAGQLWKRRRGSLLFVVTRITDEDLVEYRFILNPNFRIAPIHVNEFLKNYSLWDDLPD